MEPLQTLPQKTTRQTNVKGGKGKPIASKAKTNKKRKGNNDRGAVLTEQMGDVQEPLALGDPEGNMWMAFSGDVVDNLRQMLTRLTRKQALPARLSIVSTLPDEGVTYISRALATVMANDLSARVGLVDLNWWHPASPRIGAANNEGLVAVVTGKTRLDEIFVPTYMPNLTIIPAGRLDRRDRPIMARSHVLKSALNVLGSYFDHLILDIPALRMTNDAVPLAALGDATCLVIHQGVTSLDSAKLAMDEISHLNVIGSVMNQFRTSTPRAILNLLPQD